jgi:hypothetical protein
LKAYCKHCELLAHPPSEKHFERALFEELLEWTRPHLRIELTLRRPELKDRGTLNEAIIWEFFRKIEVSAMVNSTHAPESLRPNVRAALQLWYTGTDLSATYPRASLYRYRKAILDATGIDVLLPMVKQSESAQPALLSLEDLRAREVTTTPARIQRSLFGAGG